MIARIKSWISGSGPSPFLKTKPVIKIVRVESQNITMLQWRSMTTSLGASMELAKHPIYVAQRDILESIHPRHAMLKMGTAEIDRVVHQARIEGYEQCLWNMDLFARPIKQKREVEATFEAPAQTV